MVHQIGLPSNPVQKCDAKRPCTTCIKARGVSECVYDNEKHPQLAGVYPVHRTDGRPSGQDPGGAHPIDIPAVTSTHPPAKQNPTPSNSSTVGAVTRESPAPRMFEADQDQAPPGTLQLVRARRNSSGRRPPLDSDPFISVISRCPPPEIPVGPQVLLSSLGGGRFQVQTTEMDITELDTRGCVSK